MLLVLEQWGWYVISVAAEPTFSYSIGLYQHFQHPEIIVFGLSYDTGHRVINDAGKRIKEGFKYNAQCRYDDLLQDYECEFRSVDPSRYDGHLNYAMWYYQNSDFPAIQLIWPDKQHRFPWEPDFAEEFRDDQPMLEHS